MVEVIWTSVLESEIVEEEESVYEWRITVTILPSTGHRLTLRRWATEGFGLFFGLSWLDYLDNSVKEAKLTHLFNNTNPLYLKISLKCESAGLIARISLSPYTYIIISHF